MGRKVAEHVIELPDSYEGSTDSEELGRGFGILWRAGGLEGGSLYYHVSRIKGGKWAVHRDLVYACCVSLTSWLISIATSSFCYFVWLIILSCSLFFIFFNFFCF